MKNIVNVIAAVGWCYVCETGSLTGPFPVARSYMSEYIIIYIINSQCIIKVVELALKSASDCILLF
jgi:hypothetical protein